MGKTVWVTLKYMDFLFGCAGPAVGWFPWLTLPGGLFFSLTSPSLPFLLSLQSPFLLSSLLHGPQKGDAARTAFLGDRDVK